MKMVHEFFQNLGFGEINEMDSKLIEEMADADGDGVIGLDEFRLMVPLGTASNAGNSGGNSPGKQQ